MVEKPYFCKVISIWIAFLRLASLMQFFAVFFFIYYLKQKIIKILNQVFLINTNWRSLLRAFVVIRNKSFQVMLNKIFWINCNSLKKKYKRTYEYNSEWCLLYTIYISTARLWVIIKIFDKVREPTHS